MTVGLAEFTEWRHSVDARLGRLESGVQTLDSRVQKLDLRVRDLEEGMQKVQVGVQTIISLLDRKIDGGSQSGDS